MVRSKWSAQIGLLKMVCSKWSAQIGLLKMVCSNWSAQNGLLKMVCSNWSAQIGLLKLVCSNWSAQNGLLKLVCSKWSAQIGPPRFNKTHLFFLNSLELEYQNRWKTVGKAGTFLWERLVYFDNLIFLPAFLYRP